VDLAAHTGGAIDSPIYILGQGGRGSRLWYWDGTAIHDYIELPAGFFGFRCFFYQGVLYINGARLQPSGNYSPCAYYVSNDTLGFLGYFGNIQSNGDPTPSAGTSVGGDWSIDASDNFIFFTVPFLNSQEIWRYDIVNGGLSRYFSLGNVGVLDGMTLHRGAPWVSVFGVGLYSSRATFPLSGQLITSDLHLGQLWTSNLWTVLENSFGILRSGEEIHVDYSTDQGASWTNDALVATYGADGAIDFKRAVISTSNVISVKGTFIRLRITLKAGTSQLTTPSLLIQALKATPTDPSGPVIDCWVSCPTAYVMPNGQADWQGASGSERLRNIIDLFETQNVVKVIYLAPGTTRAKNPTTIDMRVIDYELNSPSGLLVGPDREVEGDMHVVLRAVV
jgi:hypothetical protein